MTRVGRPTSYDPAFIEKVDEYLEQCKDIEDEFHKTRGEKSDSYERLVRVKLPSRDGFSVFINVSRDSLHKWSKEYPEFSDALDDIDRAQKIALFDNGLSGTYNPTIAKLGLSANHGMREGTDLTSNGKEIRIAFDDSFKKE